MQKRIVLVVVLGLICNPFLSFSQDSIPENTSKSEQQYLDFQTSFFKALSEKAIRNYQNAIQSLEICNQIKPNDISVLFELSKNYLFLNKTQEAEMYAKKALEIDENNIWVLEHLVEIYKKNRDYKSAIIAQKSIIALNPKKQIPLVYLYLQNRNYDEVQKLLISMQKTTGLNRNLKNILSGFKKNEPQKDTSRLESLSDFIKKFNETKEYAILKKLLEKAKIENDDILREYSAQGISLFPAQPFVYLMSGISLNKNKEYKKALEPLLNGIDFVIENKDLEKQFHQELAISYRGLGNNQKASEHTNKAQGLK